MRSTAASSVQGEAQQAGECVSARPCLHPSSWLGHCRPARPGVGALTLPLPLTVTLTPTLALTLTLTTTLALTLALALTLTLTLTLTEQGASRALFILYYYTTQLLILNVFILSLIHI